MDWNLRACGWRGHETYAPDEPDLQERLHVVTPAGEAWRCLRCATYVVGDPLGSGPADQAPEVPRGRLLRDRTLMRLLAVERGLRAVVILLLAWLVFWFRGSRHALEDAFNTDLPLLRPLGDQLGWNVDNSWVVEQIHRLFSLSESTLTWVALALVAYAALQITEAVGLWLVKRWGEYFAVIATSLFLPLEIHELIARVTFLRLAAFVVNVAAVVWLLWSKRLFGIRGGAAAYHAEHSAESLLTVERAALPTTTTTTPN